MHQNTLTITDNRTGKAYEIPIEHGALRAIDLRQIKADQDDFGLLCLECHSRLASKNSPGWGTGAPGEAPLPQASTSADSPTSGGSELLSRVPQEHPSFTWLFLEGNEGEQVFQENCSLCHSVDRVRAKHLSRGEWQQIIERMIGFGCPIPPALFS